MRTFSGFSANRNQGTLIPLEFFSLILPKIEDLHELKTILFVIWFIENNEVDYAYITASQFIEDKLYFSGLGNSASEQKDNLEKSIRLALADQILLKSDINLGTVGEEIFFLNTPEGRQAIEMLKDGSLSIQSTIENPVKLIHAQPNIFKIYEENIGVITPVIANALTELEKEYPLNWIVEAIQEAVKNNVRKLRYIEVILKNWQEEGRHERTNRRRSQKNQEGYDPDRYTDGEFSDFIDR